MIFSLNKQTNHYHELTLLVNFIQCQIVNVAPNHETYPKKSSTILPLLLFITKYPNGRTPTTTQHSIRKKARSNHHRPIIKSFPLISPIMHTHPNQTLNDHRHDSHETKHQMFKKLFMTSGSIYSHKSILRCKHHVRGELSTVHFLSLHVMVVT